MTWVLSWCSRHGLDPIDFYNQHYAPQPRGYQLVAAFEAFKAMKEEEEMEKAKRSSR